MDIKPCPLCGSDKIEYKPTHFGDGESRGVMRCLECGCTVPTSEFGKHVKEPYSEWNRREIDLDELLKVSDDISCLSREGFDNPYGDVTCNIDELISYSRRIRKALGVER